MYLSQPALALDRVRLEIGRLGQRVIPMSRDSFDVVTAGDGQAISRLRDPDDSVDALHAAIVDYLGRISVEALVDPLPRRIQEYLGIANYLENVGDVVATDLVEAAEDRHTNRLALRSEVVGAIGRVHETACQVLEEALLSFSETAVDRALAARERKGEFNSLTEAARALSAQDLAAGGATRLDSYRVETDIVECYSRVHSLARRISRLEALGARESTPPVASVASSR